MAEAYVYILTSNNREAIYTGVTSNLERRIYEHKSGKVDGHTKKYNITNLVCVETISSMKEAIKREHQIKNWRREKKDGLVDKNNPLWEDLAKDWFMG